MESQQQYFMDLEMHASILVISILNRSLKKEQALK
jgi:hypothetical protein